MPSKLRFHLTGEPPAHPFQHASGLRALLLDWLGRTAPDRAADLHQANQPKPYTIGPLWPEGNDTAHLWFDVSLLDDRLAPLLSEAAGEEQEVRLGPQHFTVASLPERREAIAWEDLVPETVCTRPRLLVRLLTPTAHHAAGPHRKVVVSPSPETYFKGWLGRWNLCATRWGCAPFVIDASVLEAVESHVAIAALSGRSEMVRALDPRRHFTGFVGEVTFEVLQPHTLSHGLRASLEALGRFANYAGTGIETMRGMGQTQVRILDKPPRSR